MASGFDDKTLCIGQIAMSSCIICEENFNDNITPRNLPCGHTFCTSCVNNYISKGKSKICPECRQPFSASSASDLPINYPLLRLTRSGLSSQNCGTNVKFSEKDILWNNKAIIQDYGFGPVWRTNNFQFTCKIASPQKQSEFFGLKNYIAYSVTPSFSSKHVLRRYKQFDMIQDQLRIAFPQIVLPRLPEKQVLGRFDENLIQYRVHSLQTWIDRICRHPILSHSDIFRFFITVSNEKTWIADVKKIKSENVYDDFYSKLEVPLVTLDLPTIENKLESYDYYVKELEQSIKELLHTSMYQENEYKCNFRPEKESISQCFLKLAQAFSLATSESPTLPVLVLHVGEAYSRISDLSTESVVQAWNSLFNLLSEYQMLVEELKRVHSVARENITEANKMEIDSEKNVKLSWLVFHAEIGHFNKCLVREIKKLIRSILQKELELNQKITNELQESLNEIVNDGIVIPSAPCL